MATAAVVRAACWSLRTTNFPSSRSRSAARSQPWLNLVATLNSLQTTATRSTAIVVRRPKATTTTSPQRPQRPPTLHHEWVVDGRTLSAKDRRAFSLPDRTVVLLHGLLGNGKNLRTPAKRLTASDPRLSALLLDLRGHGGSSSAVGSGSGPSSLFPPPYNFRSLALDVARTVESLNLTGPRSPGAVVGHSLAGRVALQYSADLAVADSSGSNPAATTTIVRPPQNTWILDSVPGAAHTSVAGVVAALESVPIPIADRKGLAERLSSEFGLPRSVVAWVCSSLARRPSGDGFRFAFDLPVAKELLERFREQDFLSLLRRIVTDGRDVHVVMAGKNSAWTRTIIDELDSVRTGSDDIGGGEEDEAFGGHATRRGTLEMHKLEKAGHWVHVDDLEGLLHVMKGRL